MSKEQLVYIFPENEVLDLVEEKATAYPLQKSFDEKDEEVVYDFLFKPDSETTIFLYAYSSKNKDFPQKEKIKENWWVYVIVESKSKKVIEQFWCDTTDWETL